jgi:hypothetical protein
VCRTDQSAILEFHQPPGSKGDHLAQQTASGAFSTSERKSIIGSVIGGVLSQELAFATRP